MSQRIEQRTKDIEPKEILKEQKSKKMKSNLLKNRI